MSQITKAGKEDSLVDRVSCLIKDLEVDSDEIDLVYRSIGLMQEMVNYIKFLEQKNKALKEDLEHAIS